MEKINAPFSQSQIDNLNYYQQHGSLHPFTCAGSDLGLPECKRLQSTQARTAGKQVDYSDENEGVLIATVEGWTCPCGRYKQDWAWDFMMLPPDEQDRILSQGRGGSYE